MNSIQAMKEALKMREVPNEGVKSLLVALAQDVRPGNGFDVWPGLETLADRMAVSRRTAERRKTAAIRAGLISATPRQRSEGRGRTSDLIHLDFLDDQPDDSCRPGRGKTNPTARQDQPDSPGMTNPTTAVGGLDREESKELEQEERDGFAVAQTRKDDTFVSPEQEDFFGHEEEGHWLRATPTPRRTTTGSPKPTSAPTSKTHPPLIPPPSHEHFTDDELVALADDEGIGFERNEAGELFVELHLGRPRAGLLNMAKHEMDPQLKQRTTSTSAGSSRQPSSESTRERPDRWNREVPIDEGPEALERGHGSNARSTEPLGPYDPRVER